MLNKSNLEDIYGLLLNYINEQQDSSDWDLLSENQKNGIYKAINEINDGKHLLNEDVLEKYKSKYLNG